MFVIFLLNLFLLISNIFVYVIVSSDLIGILALKIMIIFMLGFGISGAIFIFIWTWTLVWRGIFLNLFNNIELSAVLVISQI